MLYVLPRVALSRGAPNEAEMAETTTRKSVKEGIERHIIGEEGNVVLLRMNLALVLYLPFLGSGPRTRLNAFQLVLYV